MVGDLLKIVNTDESRSKRGWAIAALAEIGGQDVDEYLLNVHADENQEKIVRTWAEQCEGEAWRMALEMCA